MIINNQPLSMAEAMDYLKGKDVEEGNPELVGFIKNFVSLKKGQGKDMREKIEALDVAKIKPEHVSKIIDLLPDNKEDLNKIFIEVSLEEDESNKVLEIVKQYR